jgi:hypothetical protein
MAQRFWLTDFSTDLIQKLFFNIPFIKLLFEAVPVFLGKNTHGQRMSSFMVHKGTPSRDSNPDLLLLRRMRWPKRYTNLIPISCGAMRLLEQGCQMVYFHTKKCYLGKFWTALEIVMLVLMVIWNIVRLCGTFHMVFGIFCGHLVHFSSFWYVETMKIWQPWFRSGRCDGNV